MGIIYLIVAILGAVITFLFCRKHHQPVFWPAVCVALPPAAAFLIFKTKLEKSKLFAAVIAGLFVAGIGAEAALLLTKSTEEEETTPPIIKKVEELNEDIKKATIDIYNASGKLHSISMVQSRITDIKSSIATIEKLRDLEKKNQEAIDNLLEFIDEHQAFFLRKQMDWIFSIQLFYSDYYVVQHHKSRDQYLAAFEVLLKYTYDNFENIMDKKSAQHQQSYNVYYMRYRRAADAHNRFNRKRITFQKNFMKEHPEVKPFLPGSHHHEPFKFWDKFQF